VPQLSGLSCVTCAPSHATLSPFRLCDNEAVIGFAIMNIVIIWDMTADGLVKFTDNSEEIIAAIIRIEE
jgi:hypothetical protein